MTLNEGVCGFIEAVDWQLIDCPPPPPTMKGAGVLFLVLPVMKNYI